MQLWAKRGDLIYVIFLALLWIFVEQLSRPSREPVAEANFPSALQTHGSEDWSTISLENTHLHAEEPIVGEKTDFPSFTRELIQVQWRPNDAIDLYVIRPKGVERPPAILYLYPYYDNTPRFRDNGYCERVTKDGFAAIGFVSALSGYRFRMRPMRETFLSELPEALVTSTHDVQMILNYLSERHDFDMSRIGIFGVSSGGSIAILAAAADSRIRAVDVLDPWGDWPDWLARSARVPREKRAEYLKPEFLQHLSNLDPMHWLPKVRAEHLRVRQILEDVDTPEAAREKIKSAAPPSAHIVRFENSAAFARTASGGQTFQWIKDQLQEQPPETARQ